MNTLRFIRVDSNLAIQLRVALLRRSWLSSSSTAATEAARQAANDQNETAQPGAENHHAAPQDSAAHPVRQPETRPAGAQGGLTLAWSSDAASDRAELVQDDGQQSFDFGDHGVVVPIFSRSGPGGDNLRSDGISKPGTAPVQGAPYGNSRRFALRFGFWTGLTLTGLAAAATMAVPAYSLATKDAAERKMQELTAARTGVIVLDADGAELGLLPQPHGDPNHVAWPQEGRNRDLMSGLTRLESNWEYFGISPLRAAMAMGCFATVAPLHGSSAAKRSCGGGSTLLMQASTLARGGKRGRSLGERKATELSDAVGLSWNMTPGSEARERFLLTNLPFGDAGLPIAGVVNAAHVLTGRRLEDLELADSLILASAVKRPMAFYCRDVTSAEREDIRMRWRQLRNRAIYALDREFSARPDYRTIRTKLLSMPDRFRPADLPANLGTGLSPRKACLASANPLQKFEILDSSIRNVAVDEILALPVIAGHPITGVRLGARLADQRGFKADVEQTLAGMQAAKNEGQWLRNLVPGNNPSLPGAGPADVLAFTTDKAGVLQSLYTSNGRPLLFEQRRLGSVSKLVALLALARAGRTVDTVLCNHAYRGLQNAGGDRGFADCRDPRARTKIVDAFAESKSLPILDELRKVDPRLLAETARLAGLRDPGNDLPYALAFGVAEGRPAELAALASAMANGLAGQSPADAQAAVPHAISSYRRDGSWHRFPARTIDLSNYFASSTARTLIAAAGGAALRSGRGTLRAAVGNVPAGRFEIAKSGTDAREGLRTYAKTALGSRDGFGWMAMVAADKGPVGESRVQAIPLVKLTRDRAARMQGDSPSTVLKRSTAKTTE